MRWEGFFSVDQNRHHLSAGDRKAEPEEEQQIEHKLPEPDSRGAEVHGAGDGGTYLTPVSVVAGLLKVVPELQREKFYPDEQWEKHPGGKPSACRFPLLRVRQWTAIRPGQARMPQMASAALSQNKTARTERQSMDC